MNKKRLSILIYHRVLDEEDPLRKGEVDIHQFESQMSALKTFCNVLDLDEAITRLNNSSLPSRAVSITFDDGYKDNYTRALPILKKLGLSATFFIATEPLNGGIMWNDVIIEAIRNTKLSNLDLKGYGLRNYDVSTNKSKAVESILSEVKYLPYDKRKKLVENIPEILGVENPTNLMMDDGDVSQLAKEGMGIGGHTSSHPILTRLDDQSVKEEIINGKAYLERLTGREIKLFAYPNGKPLRDYHKGHVDMIKSIGFKAAVSTAWGVASSQSDLYQLPRFTPWDRSIVRYMLRLAKMRVSAAEEVA